MTPRHMDFWIGDWRCAWEEVVGAITSSGLSASACATCAGLRLNATSSRIARKRHRSPSGSTSVRRNRPLRRVAERGRSGREDRCASFQLDSHRHPRHDDVGLESDRVQLSPAPATRWATERAEADRSDRVERLLAASTHQDHAWLAVDPGGGDPLPPGPIVIVVSIPSPRCPPIGQ